MTWFRKSYGAYHKAAPDYIDTGKALCGFLVYPGSLYTSSGDDQERKRLSAMGIKFCLRCFLADEAEKAKKEARG